VNTRILKATANDTVFKTVKADFTTADDLHTFFIISWDAVNIIVSAERENTVFAGYGVTAFVYP
jgi:hypothetical protein